MYAPLAKSSLISSRILNNIEDKTEGVPAANKLVLIEFTS